MPSQLPRIPKRPDFHDVSPARHRNMAAISGKNTTPELCVRRMLHKMGYRYRLHVKDLPGRPDIVFPRRRKIIEVRGCFWHRHPNCAFAATPRTRSDFWESKFQSTVARDSENLSILEASGWCVMILWGCELKNVQLTERLRTFLEQGSDKSKTPG